MVLILVSLLLAAPTVADDVRVTFLKGKAIYVSPNQKKYLLKKGMLLKKDGLIKTAKRSILKIQFTNGSTLSMGPESSMTVNHEVPTKPKLVELIRGKVRGAINPKIAPQKGFDHKMIIKTRSASVGVRGTEFVVIYNEKNHITSNITLKGEVDLYKKSDEVIFEDLREELDKKGRRVKLGQDDQILAMEQDLKNYRTKRVPVGHFAGAFPSYEKAISPVQISDHQLLALGKNKNLKMGTKGKVKRSGVSLGPLKSPNSSLVPEPRKSQRLDKNEYNKNQNDEGVRHGGHVDLNTGIYIAPPEGAPLDKKTGKYLVPDELGGVDSETGEYIPPHGVKLDPLYGFKYDESIPKDRNVRENLEKLQNLTGPFYQQIGKALEIFKEITRLDLYAIGNYRFVTNALENYYGEFRKISNEDTMLWDLQGVAGFQLFHNEDWLIYPKASINWRYYEDYQENVRRLNQYTGMLGGEVHYKHSTLGRKSRLIFDLAFTTRYQNYRKRKIYDFYTEDTALKVTERLNLNTHNTLALSYQVRAFHGFQDPDHGNIHALTLDHEFELGDTWSLLYGANWSYRDNKLDNDIFQIFAGHLKFKWRELLPKTNLTFGYTYQHHETRKRANFDHALYYKADVLFQRDLGQFWKFNLLYEYDRQRAYHVPVGGERRSFIRQSWGAGLTLFF